MGSKKILLTLGIILTIALAIAGSTYAYLEWVTSDEQGTNVVFTLEQDFSCAVDGGGNITSADVAIAPSSCTNSAHAIMREITVTPSILRDNLEIGMDLWINVDSIDQEFSNTDNLRYALTTLPNDCIMGIVSTGSFKDLTAGAKVPILEKTFSSSTPATYYLWLWLDAKETSTSTIQKNFTFSLGGNCVDTPQNNKFYVVYSEDDYSLRFYKEDENIINVGSSYNGRTATAVYKIYGAENFFQSSPPPWSEYANEIKDVVVEDAIAPINTQSWFYNLKQVETVDVRNLDSSNLTNMRGMFNLTGSDVTSLTITGLENFNTSNVVEMSGLFSQTGENATYLSIGNLSSWDTSKVKNMTATFQHIGKNSTSLILSGINNWDVSNVINMDRMFNAAGYMANWSLDLSNWDVSNVTSHKYFNDTVTDKVIAPIWNE